MQDVLGMEVGEGTEELGGKENVYNGDRFGQDDSSHSVLSLLKRILTCTK